MQNILRRGMPGRRGGRGGQEKFVFILNGKIRRHTWWEEGLGGGTRDAREVQATTLFVVDKWMDAVPHDRAAAEQQQQQAAAAEKTRGGGESSGATERECEGTYDKAFLNQTTVQHCDNDCGGMRCHMSQPQYTHHFHLSNPSPPSKTSL